MYKIEKLPYDIASISWEVKELNTMTQPQPPSGGACLFGLSIYRTVFLFAVNPLLLTFVFYFTTCRNKLAVLLIEKDSIQVLFLSIVFIDIAPH